MNYYIKNITGFVTTKGYENTKILSLKVTLDSKMFNKFKKTQDPIGACLAQVKNIVWDATGINSIPSYAPVSYSQRYPRASKGLVIICLDFEISEFKYKELALVDDLKLKETLESTRNDQHLFAKTVIAAKIAN